MGLFSRFSKKTNKEDSFTCFICKQKSPSSQKSGNIGTQIACMNCAQKFMALVLLKTIKKERELNVRELGTFERLMNSKSQDDPNTIDREDRKLYESQFEKLGIEAPNGPRHDSDPEDAILYNFFKLNNERYPVFAFNCQKCKQEVIIEGTNAVPIGIELVIYLGLKQSQ